MFLTDRKNSASKIGKDLLTEATRYSDLYFQDLEGGHDFGKRFLFHMVWAMQNYKFDYFVRMDDDYFLCMDRFILEVPMPPKSLYHWGWVHCIQGIVRPEESVILLSKDIIAKYLGQDPDKILCNRWADQMIAIWSGILKLPNFYRHDDRLHHHPPARDVETFRTERNICTTYIGIHGSYPQQMLTLWKHRGKKIYPAGKSLDDYASSCQYDSVFDWRSFSALWKAQPKLCKTNPDWGGSHGITYSGRQGTR